MSLLAELLACVQSEFWADQTKAGVVLSQLDSVTVYASICRYPNGPSDKKVLCSAKAEDLDKALRALAVQWLIHTKRFETLRTKLDAPKPFDSCLRRVLAATR